MFMDKLSLVNCFNQDVSVKVLRGNRWHTQSGELKGRHYNLGQGFYSWGWKEGASPGEALASSSELGGGSWALKPHPT